MPPQTAAIRRFVQGVLGCGCPEEVFERIEEGRLQWDGVTARSVTVGGRLLIAILGTDDANLVRANLPRWVEGGRRERDARGLNRIRIVIASSRPGDLEPVARAAFSGAAPGDDRIHLHVVDRAGCPWEAV